MSGTATPDTVAVSVHGHWGALDLLVPAGASVVDVAREYADQVRLPRPPTLMTSTGRLLPPDLSLASVSIESGDVLVASYGPATPGPAPTQPGGASGPSRLASAALAGWLVAAAALALTAAGLAVAADGQARSATVALLAVAAVIGVLPLGRYAEPRALAAPACGGAAAFIVAFEPGPAHLPASLGIAALGAALVAAVGRTAAAGRPEAHDVWIAGGLLVFASAAGGVLIGAEPHVVWAVLLTLAMLAARFVPALAIDVPDQMLIDLERLAVTAWSARDRTTGRRGRMVVAPAGIDQLLARGARLVTAACVAILAVTVVAVPELLRTATADLDRQGALVLVLLVGGGLLLAARSYRHATARALLQAAGVYCWAAVAVRVLVPGSDDVRLDVALVVVGLSACLVAAAIATGRGWRSVWWARRAEIAEVVCGSFALGALVVAAGVFRRLWEMTS